MDLIPVILSGSDKQSQAVVKTLPDQKLLICESVK